MKVTAAGLEGGIAKFYEASAAAIKAGLGAAEGDLVLLVGAPWRTACTALGAVRSRLGRELGLIKKGEFKFAWVVDFPLFEWNEEAEKWDPAHHMFTMPQERFLSTMEQDPGAVKGDRNCVRRSGGRSAEAAASFFLPPMITTQRSAP